MGSSFLETYLSPVWTSFSVHLLDSHSMCFQHWRCKLSQLCSTHRCPCDRSILRVSPCCPRSWGCSGDVLCQATWWENGSVDVSQFLAYAEVELLLTQLSLLATLGPSLGPFIAGFIAQNLGWRWIFWILAIINGAQAICYFLFGAETRYIPHPTNEFGHQPKRSWAQNLFYFRRIDPKPLTTRDFLGPLLLAGRLTVIVPTVAYSVVFCFTNVMMAIEIPQTMGQKFELNAQQIGYQFGGMIIGYVLSKLLQDSRLTVLQLCHRRATWWPPFWFLDESKSQTDRPSSKTCISTMVQLSWLCNNHNWNNCLLGPSRQSSTSRVERHTSGWNCHFCVWSSNSDYGSNYLWVTFLDTDCLECG